ncbi:class I SAM-dependent methyltransferase [Brachybacterium subflavum]|uniref:class I SAM-dependent methyltransferase n=1 Tax=Brachybacterium subflavum TaxID=2585206 RepID=UPI00126608C4|nr:class I SAM-dependent methyltransferase [Brachybacterium subflavum]
MKYYEKEHVEAYARIRAEGLDQWNDLYAQDGARGYEHFAAREFLERELPERGDGRTVFEYGCGTGGAACFMASRGYAVHAMDLVPDAIQMARERASERGLDVVFDVGDVCRGAGPGRTVDYAVDCFCLQSVVADEDRSTVLDGVHRWLEPDGLFILTTAMFEPGREYGDDRYDPHTGIVWTPSPRDTEEARLLDRTWFAPVRRHLKPNALRRELERHGLDVIVQSGEFGGNVVCVRRGTNS